MLAVAVRSLGVEHRADRLSADVRVDGAWDGKNVGAYHWRLKERGADLPAERLVGRLR